MLVRRFAAVSLALGPAVAQHTLVVDPATGPFLEISAAVAAAIPGDRIVVYPGTYGAFTVSIGVDIVAPQPGARVNALFNGITVQNLSAAHAVRIDGLELSGAAGLAPAVLAIANCAGIVHLHRLTMVETNSSIASSARVTFTASSLGGSSGSGFSSSNGGAGLQLTNSVAVLDHCTIAGGSGGSAGPNPYAGSGGSGLQLQQSSAFASDCTIVGGGGGSGYGSFSGRSGNGGDGANGDAASLLCAVGATSLAGGPGGVGGVYGNGPPGVGVAPGSAAALRFAPQVAYSPASAAVVPVGEPPRVSAPAVLPMGTTATIQVGGVADQFVLLGIDLWNDVIRIPGVELPFVLTTAASLYAFAPPTPASTVSFALPVPQAPWLASQFVHLQAVTIDGAGALQFSTGGYGRIQ